MKYKEGDRVRVQSLDWYNKNKDEFGVVLLENGEYLFSESDTIWCGKVVTIKEVCLNEYYRIVEDFDKYRWTDEMIECKVEDVNVSEFNHTQDEIMKMLLQGAINLPEDYQFVDENGNVINATKIVLEKKKKEYPKTYEECCEILDIIDNRPPWHGYRSVQLKIFQKLLICRDAYWKIAGNWKPNFGEDFIYAIGTCYGTVEKRMATGGSGILLFPTEEMRDYFYENFKELIEICKELL